MMLKLNMEINLFKSINYLQVLKYFILILFLFLVDWIIRDTIHERTFSGIIIALTLLQFSKKIFLIYTIPNLIALIIYIPIRMYTGVISYNSVLALKYTNKLETIEYLSSIPIYNYIVTFLLIFLTIVVLKQKYRKLPKFMTFIFVLIILVLGIKNVYTIIKQGINEKTMSPLLSNSFYPANTLLYKYKSYASQIEEAQKITSNQENKGWNITKSEIKKDLYVVVIGESVRNDLMNCYGFPIKNTPFTSSYPNIKFENYISVGSATIPSLTRALFYSKDLKRINKYKNLVTLAKQSKLNTIWISNQGTIGQHDEPISILGRMTHKDVFLKNDKYDGKNTSDTLLIPHFTNSLNKTTQPSLFVLHLMGSHPKASDRTNNKYDSFYKTEELSCYVQSIKNTDLLLSKIYFTLKETKKSFVLLYFSDHGLSITKNKIGKEYQLKHTDQYKEAYNVPLILWTDDLVESKTIQAYRYSNDFLLLMSELFGVTVEDKSHSSTFISEQEYPNEQKILNFEYKKINYQDLKNNKIE